MGKCMVLLVDTQNKLLRAMNSSNSNVDFGDIEHMARRIRRVPKAESGITLGSVFDGLAEDEILHMSADEVVQRAENIKAGAAQITNAGSSKIGRNEPCPCGSGRKYKICCGLRS